VRRASGAPGRPTNLAELAEAAPDAGIQVAAAGWDDHRVWQVATGLGEELVRDRLHSFDRVRIAQRPEEDELHLEATADRLEQSEQAVLGSEQVLDHQDLRPIGKDLLELVRH
jgi:hypothetical protein